MTLNEKAQKMADEMSVLELQQAQELYFLKHELNKLKTGVVVPKEIIATLESKLRDVGELKKKFSDSHSPLRPPFQHRTEKERSAFLHGMQSGIEYVLSTIKGGK